MVSGVVYNITTTQKNPPKDGLPYALEEPARVNCTDSVVKRLTIGPGTEY